MKPCCKDMSKRTVVQERHDLRVSTCQTCGCRHFELTVGPGVIGLRGEQLG